MRHPTPHPEASSPAGQTSAAKWPRVLIVVLLGALLSGGGFFGYRIMAAKAKAVGRLKVGSVVELEEFLVNLADQKTFLKTRIALGIAEGRAINRTETPGEPPQVRDAIIMLLTAKKPEEVATYPGKQLLKKEIIRAINALYRPAENSSSSDKPTDGPNLPSSAETQAEEPNPGPVLEVYFTSFATQKY